MAESLTPLADEANALLEQIYLGYEMAESLWLSSESQNTATVAVFYLTSLAGVREKPYGNEYVQRRVVRFLEDKRDNAMENLSAKDAEEVAVMLKAIL